MKKLNKAKFRELVLYVASKSHDDPWFGALKLNKLLFLCDFEAYVQLGQPITGMEYFRLDMGPAPRQLLPIQKEMETEKDIAIQRSELRAGRVQNRTLALRAPRLDCFSAHEISLVDQILSEFRRLNGTELSEASHAFHGWALAKDRETIPYEVALVTSRAPDLADQEYARTLVPEARRALGM